MKLTCQFWFSLIAVQTIIPKGMKHIRPAMYVNYLLRKIQSKLKDITNLMLTSNLNPSYNLSLIMIIIEASFINLIKDSLQELGQPEKR